MKLSTRDDIEAPIAFVFEHLTDFEAWERAALRRGAEVQRTDRLAAPGPGLSWEVAFDFRGRRRELDLRLDRMEPPVRLVFSGVGPNSEGTLDIELIELAARRTRVAVRLEVKPRTLVARLFLQSLKLAKARVEGRFKSRVAQLAAEIADRHARLAAR
jgi:carbon monoxide dehydrogenase subunit G